ncbi:uncharacterized protein LOC113207463 [Frankliniella occidentalis]|uniref:Uncharacterized protein LOC113207463 n=1 Tax=Frankliniella occidentalis TaxID=133901 RepID=A0A6J1SFP5_FRAOC|nr:uncharacterized protein LOC113207463 [Frankliniella occidentalis]
MATVPSLPLYVVVDLTFPIDSALAETCVMAVENTITLACFLREEVTNFGIICIDDAVHSVCRPVLTEGNNGVSWIYSTIYEGISKQFNSGIRVAPADFKDLLLLAVRNALDERPIASLTVISCREGRLIADWLETLSKDQVLAADSFQVVELSRNEAQHASISVCQPPRDGRPAVRLAVVPVAPAGATAPRASSGGGKSQLQATLEATLRAAWFTPRWSEMISLQLVMSQTVELECVASPSVADPSSLPVADLFLIPGTAGGGGGVRTTTGGGAKVVLEALCRVAADGVCEGSLFGAPLRVLWSPPFAFRGNDQEYRQNAHMFLALCESLDEAGEFLVLKRLGGSQALDLGGHFIAMPGDECLLVRAVASAELVLPAPAPPPLQYGGLEAANAGREVRGALDGLAVVEQYTAKQFPSHLCAALKLTTSFPERLSLGSLACPRPQAWSTGAAPRVAPINKCVAAVAPPEQDAGQAHQGKAVGEALSSDEELAEENTRPLMTAAQPRARTSMAVHGAPAPAPHKLGTGGHPALDTDSRTSAKRKRAPSLFRVFKSRRH